MPIPKPSPDEKQADFISRCMSDTSLEKEFPDQAQRTAVCFDSWRTAKGENMKKEEIKRDEKGRIIVAENVPVILSATIHTEDD